ETLSDREKEIISCVAHGLSNKEIADKLCLSFHTVTTYSRNISEKLNIHSTAALVIFAIVNKIVDIHDIPVSSV
ncbi:MAG: helix-turn-helix transcriptional regulator, partial [Muribaculum sp.]|nr:helix-turn-helix transcriptional regulator [Muribaculum sp.]